MFTDKIKLEKLADIKNMSADQITEEQLTAINAEVSEKGFGAVEVIIAGTVASLEAKVTEANEASVTLTTANETLTADLATATAKVTDLEAKLVEANAKLGQKAAATPAEIKAEQDRIAREGESKDFDFETSPSAKALAKFNEK